MRFVRVFAVFLALATIGYAALRSGSELFIYLVPVAAVSIFLLIAGAAPGSVPRLKLAAVLATYGVVAVMSLVALTVLNPVAEGGVVLLFLASVGTLMGLRASYLSTRKRRYGLSSYYG